MSRIARAEMLKLKKSRSLFLASRTLGAGSSLLYSKEIPAKHYRTDHYTGNVLYTDCYFYRGILKFRRTWNSGTAMFLRFIDLRGIQQLYNAFLPDHPADHRYGTLNVEL